MKEPSVTVGIMSGETIGFVLNGTYLQDGHPVEGAQTARIEQGRIGWNGGLYDQLLFTPQEADHSFCLKGVTIGVKFHWERREDQTFRGALKLIVEGDRLTAINAYRAVQSAFDWMFPFAIRQRILHKHPYAVVVFHHQNPKHAASHLSSME